MYRFATAASKNLCKHDKIDCKNKKKEEAAARIVKLETEAES